MASGDDLLGFSSPGKLLYLEYGRGFLLLEEKGRPSGRTLVRLFMDRKGKAPAFEPYSSPMGTVISKPYLGGTLSLDLLRPDSLSLIISDKTIIEPSPAGPGPVIHFTAGGGIFWLGNGREYRSYNGAGNEKGYFTLEETSLEGEKVLFCEADRTGRLYLGLSGGGVLTVPGDCRGEPGADVFSVILDEGELFNNYYGEGEEILRENRPEWLADYRRWAFLQIENLHRSDPFDRELAALYRELSD